jgi:hypothetical protein
MVGALRTGSVLLAVIGALPAGLAAQSLCTDVSTQVQDRPLIAVRQAAERPDKLAFDFDVSYDRRLCSAKIGNERGLRIRINGSTALQSDVPDINSIVAQVGLRGQMYRPRALSAAERDSLTELRRRGNPAELPDSVQRVYGDLAARAATGGFLLLYDLHYRFETDHSVDTTQHAFGATVIAELPLIHQVLDLLPSLTRAPGTGAKPVRASLMLDYVTHISGTTIGTLGGRDQVWRATMQAVWSTSVFDELTLYADWQGQLLLDAPAGVVDAGLRFNPTIRVWLARRVGDRSEVVVQYVDGRLQPNYDLVSAGMIGMQILLGRR